MAGRYGSNRRPMFFLRFMVLITAILVVSLGLVILVQQLKIVDLRKFIPAGIDGVLPPPNWQSMDLLDQDRLDRMMDAIDQRAEKLDVFSKTLDETELKLEEHRKIIEKNEKSLEEEKKRLREEQKLYDKKEETITQTSRELSQMDENVAVNILQERDNQDIIWIMKVTDELAAETGMNSLVPIWLELMDPVRAAEIQRERDLIPDIEMN